MKISTPGELYAKKGWVPKRAPSSMYSCSNLTRSHLVCKIFPNGEFTIGLDSHEKLPQDVRAKPETVKNMFWENLSAEGKKWLCSIAVEKLPSLDLAIPPKLRNKTRGLKGITSYGARLIRNACHLMEEKYGIERLGFVTLTMPKLTKEDEQRVGKNWHRIVKDFYDGVGKFYERRTKRKHSYAAVTEIQPKRWRVRREYGLHLHYVFVARQYNSGSWYIKYHEIRRYWQLAVSKQCKNTYDFSHSEQCKGVYKSASRYLSKYMSKGSELISEVEKNGFEGCIPHSWYSISRNLSGAVKKRVQRSKPLAAAIVSRLGNEKLKEIVDYVGTIAIESAANGTRIVGFYGRLQEEWIGMSKHDILDNVNAI